MFVSCTQCQHNALLVLPLLREKNCVKQVGDKTSLPLDPNEVSKWERHRVPTGHLLSSNKAFSTSTWLHPIELLAQGVPWKSRNSPSCCQDCRLLSTKGLQVSIAEDNTHTTHGTWKSRADAYTELSSLCSSLFGTGWYSTAWGDINTNAIITFVCIAVLPVRCPGPMVSQSLWG